MLLLLLWLCLCWLRPTSRPPRRSGRPYLPAPILALRARKPDWVIEEVVRLRAHMPKDGCRAIALTFNRLHATRRAMTVSKSYVDRLARARRYEIEALRRRFKVRVPSPMLANLVWGLDLTGKRDLRGKDHPILGIVDHGSRFAVCLRALRDKTAITLLRALLDAIERHGRPASIRTDNEAVFTGWLFRFALAVLGIRHQRTDLHCPWMNGRVERLFGTLKGKLDRWSEATDDDAGRKPSPKVSKSVGAARNGCSGFEQRAAGFRENEYFRGACYLTGRWDGAGQKSVPSPPGRVVSAQPRPVTPLDWIDTSW